MLVFLVIITEPADNSRLLKSFIACSKDDVDRNAQ